MTQLKQVTPAYFTLLSVSLSKNQAVGETWYEKKLIV